MSERPGPAAAPTAPDDVDRIKRLIAIAAVLYALGACVAIGVMPRIPAGWRWFADWVAAPVQVLALIISAVVAVGRRGTRGHTATIWTLVCAFSGMNLVATVVWNEWRPTGSDRLLSVADACYLFDYALLTAAYAVTFLRLGGSFRSARTWLDAVTILVALLGTFWATLLGPFNPPGQSRPMGLLFGGSYAISLATLLTMAALVYLHLPGARRPPIPTLLLAAGLADAIWEIAWLANWLTSLDFFGLYYNFGDVLCCTCIICAAAIAPQRPGEDPQPASAEQRAYTFLPTLSALLAIALVAISAASSRTVDTWILVGLVVLIAALLTTRQASVRAELDGLNRALALRTADARLTELVRQSPDAFLVVDPSGLITFASPAAATVLRAAPEQLLRQPAALLFGAAHATTIRGFLGRLVEQPDAPAAVESVVATGAGAPRVLRLSGANQLANPAIAGLALIVSDITAQRALERDVLEVANQERIRLAGDIHEGFGQQLTGIAMLLQSAATKPSADPAVQKDLLLTIVAHVDEAIRSARDLARGLSPLYVVRGSLRDALLRLETDADASPSVHVDVDPRFNDRIVGAVAADHLYRIAQESVANALRHSGATRVDVALHVQGEALVLSVSDDGRGDERHPPSARGLGLRLMEYRARVIGGTFTIGRTAESGTCMRVTAPLANVAPEGASA